MSGKGKGKGKIDVRFDENDMRLVVKINVTGRDASDDIKIEIAEAVASYLAHRRIRSRHCK